MIGVAMRTVLKSGPLGGQDSILYACKMLNTTKQDQITPKVTYICLIVKRVDGHISEHGFPLFI